jgi:hypothetical protein
VRWVPNSAAGTACMDLRCVLPPLDMPGCFGRRNCNVNLDDLRWDRPDLDCEPQQAGASPAIFNWTRQGWSERGGVFAVEN